MYRFVLPSTLHIDDWSTDKVSFELHWDGKYRKEFDENPDENFHERIEIVECWLRFRKEEPHYICQNKYKWDLLQRFSNHCVIQDINC